MPDQAIAEFELPSTAGTPFSPARCRGKFVVLYFYPKDNTPGCTVEGQQFAELHDQFAALGCEIVGISRDSLKSHAHFKAKYQFPFELLSDPEEIACTLFAVIKNKMMYGKPARGIERSTFLIDKNGAIIHQWRAVKADGHAQAVLDFLSSLS